MPSSRPKAPKTESVATVARTLTPDRWLRVKQALGAALDLEGAAREEYLRSLAQEDAPLAGDVRELLASPMTTAGALGAPAALPFTLASEPEPEEPSLVGRQVGPYRIVAEIGRGGMGAVYRGLRDEDGKLVAIKFVRGGADSVQVQRRFQAERRILAGLEHEHIASLIDGGTTEEGWPYFTLEYVEGLPITTFCETRALPVRARLEIFLKVCAAVQYAHQRLVVHRDLKPGNILVTEDGSPKLLDFGIAKLLRGTGDLLDAPTLTLASAMTPQYASPEQVRGEDITTATDVYALGLLLYELLCGRQAQALRVAAPEELVRTICESDPRPPSTVSEGPRRRELAGDLDAIVMKALRKEPQRRYASVQALGDDLRRQLEGRPVLAHGGAWSYRAGKFVRRHRGAVLAAGLVLATLVAGVLATLRQARLAEEQRALAQARFDDVRQLADAFLFEFHDAIKDLPGATPARKLVVAKALVYLDRLLSQSASDLTLLADLSRAYQRVGDVQGSPFNANLGDTQGARQSYDKAVALGERLVAAEPGRKEWRATLARALQRQGAIQLATGEPETALATQTRSGRLLEELLRGAPDDRELLHDLHVSYIRRGDVYRERRDWPSARAEFERALELAERARARHDDRRAARDASVALSRIADTQAATDPAAALETARRMLALDELTAAREPTNAEAQRDVAIDHEDIGQRLSALERPAEALQSLGRALELRERLLALDPKNQQALQDVSVSHALIGETLAGLPGRQRDALQSYRRALEIDERILKLNPESQRSKDYAGSSHANVASMLLELGDPQGALEQFQRALELLEPLAKGDPKDLGMRCFVADLLRQRGDARVALAGRGGAAAREHWRAALHDFDASRAEWERLRALGADPAELKKADGLERRVAACRQALAG